MRLPRKAIISFFWIMIILGFCVLVGFYLWNMPYWWKIASSLEKNQAIQRQSDIMKTLAQILGGAFLLYGLYISWKRITATEKQIVISQEGQFTERFTRAIEQLGSDKLEIQLGGIYALERIAMDSERDHWAIMEVLCAYLRQHSSWEEGKSPDNESILSNFLTHPYNETRKDNYLLRQPTISHDIQAILTVLGRRNRTYLKGEDHYLDLSRLDLRGANLKGANLVGASLMVSHLDYADFTEATLRSAILFGSFLTSTDFSRANLEGCALVQVNLTKASLVQANLKAATLEKANLTNANLYRANMAGTWLKNACLKGANLKDVISLTPEQIKSAIIDENTMLPDYLNIPSAG